MARGRSGGRGTGLLRWAVLLGAVTAGCGGGGHGTATTPAAPVAEDAPAPVDLCADAGAGWRRVTASAGGRPIEAARLGDGPPVLLLDDSSDSPCAWMPLARRLARRGLSPVSLSYGSVASNTEFDSLDEVLAVARATAGSGRFAAVGASVGGRLVLEAAARRPAGLGGVVSLSGERTVESYRDILPDARRVRAPVLYVGSRQDAYTDGTAQPRALQRALGGPGRFVLLPGLEHGTDLLAGAHGDRVLRLVEAFVTRELG